MCTYAYSITAVRFYRRAGRVRGTRVVRTQTYAPKCEPQAIMRTSSQKKLQKCDWSHYFPTCECKSEKRQNKSISNTQSRAYPSQPLYWASRRLTISESVLSPVMSTALAPVTPRSLSLARNREIRPTRPSTAPTTSRPYIGVHRIARLCVCVRVCM